MISLFYYFRIAKALFLVPEEEARYQITPAPALNSILFLFWAGHLRELCQRSLDILR